MKKNLPMLQTLYRCSPKERATLLKVANPDLNHGMCDYITNIQHNNIPISWQQKGALQMKKRILRELFSKETETPRKKKLLVQHGGNIFKTILGTVLNVLTSL